MRWRVRGEHRKGSYGRPFVEPTDHAYVCAFASPFVLSALFRRCVDTSNAYAVSRSSQTALPLEACSRPAKGTASRVEVALISTYRARNCSKSLSSLRRMVLLRSGGANRNVTRNGTSQRYKRFHLAQLPQVLSGPWPCSIVARACAFNERRPKTTPGLHCGKANNSITPTLEYANRAISSVDMSRKAPVFWNPTAVVLIHCCELWMALPDRKDKVHEGSTHSTLSHANLIGHARQVFGFFAMNRKKKHIRRSSEVVTITTGPLD